MKLEGEKKRKQTKTKTYNNKNPAAKEVELSALQN